VLDSHSDRRRRCGEGVVKIVYSIGTTVGGGGLGVDSLEALRAIHAKGYLAKVVAYGNRQSEIPASRFRCVGFFNPTRIFANLPARYYYPIKRKYLDRLAREELARGADLFHGWSSSSLESLRFCRDRGIVSILENPGPYCTVAESLIEAEYAALGVRRKSRPAVFRSFFEQDEAYHLAEYAHADYILCESSYTLETFAEHGVSRDRLLLVPRGVDLDRFSPGPAKDRTPFRALFVGALRVRKGIRYLLEAWNSLRLPGAELILAGTVSDDVAPLLESCISRNPSIRLAGHVKDPVGLYRSASVFVFPSLSEGSAKVCYEAMACGLPVVVTPNAGSVARDGVEGFLVPPHDAETLAGRIEQLYRDGETRETMGRAARVRMREFTWEAHRERLLELYGKVYRREPAPDRPL